MKHDMVGMELLYGESVIYFYMLDDNLETNVASLNSISS